MIELGFDLPSFNSKKPRLHVLLCTIDISYYQDFSVRNNRHIQIFTLTWRSVALRNLCGRKPATFKRKRATAGKWCHLRADQSVSHACCFPASCECVVINNSGGVLLQLNLGKSFHNYYLILVLRGCSAFA